MPLLDALAARAIQLLPEFTSQNLSNTLLAYAKLEHRPAGDLLDRAAAESARRLHEFNPQVCMQSPEWWRLKNRLMEAPQLDIHQQNPVSYSLCHDFGSFTWDFCPLYIS